MALFLGIDLGTSYFKAALFDEQGQLCGLGRESVQKTVTTTTCELPVALFWSTLHNCVAQAMSAAGAHRHDIRAVSYSSQANSFILLDKDDHPLTPLILWPDERAGAPDPAISLFNAREDWQQVTGMGITISANSCITKLQWFRKQELWKQVKSVCTISDYLTLSLTGERAADGSTASLLGLLDAQQCRWWGDALEAAFLPSAFLSPLYRMGTPVGKLTQVGAEKIGLHATTHYSLGGLDHHMAAMGAGIYGTNNLSESTGTVLAAVQSSSTYLPEKEVCVAPGLHAGHYFRMAFDGNGAGALEQYQKLRAPGISIEALLESGDVEVQQILESTAISLKDIVSRLGATDATIVATGGGARSKRWVEVKATVLGQDFVIPATNEAACLGAAMLAARASGAINDVQDWIKVKEYIMHHIGT